MFSKGARTLLSVLAPFRTTYVNLRISDHLSALRAFELWVIPEKLYGITASVTLHLENIFRLPESLVLSGTSDHLSFSDFGAMGS